MEWVSACGIRLYDHGEIVAARWTYGGFVLLFAMLALAAGGFGGGGMRKYARQRDWLAAAFCALALAPASMSLAAANGGTLLCLREA